MVVKYLLDTDIMVDYLTSNENNYLINLMQSWYLFYNGIECI